MQCECVICYCEKAGILLCNFFVCGAGYLFATLKSLEKSQLRFQRFRRGTKVPEASVKGNMWLGQPVLCGARCIGCNRGLCTIISEKWLKMASKNTHLRLPGKFLKLAER